jgi:phenylpropionate dioxygenase-like ring-hydroxylating dioxygenase large terminal subunit
MDRPPVSTATLRRLETVLAHLGRQGKRQEERQEAAWARPKGGQHCRHHDSRRGNDHSDDSDDSDDNDDNGDNDDNDDNDADGDGDGGEETKRTVSDIEDLGDGAAAAHSCSRAQRAACRQRGILRTSACGADAPTAPTAHSCRVSSTDVGDGDPSWLFHPDRFRETQRPLLEASTLPREVYSSRLWFEREMERVFAPSWTLLGRVDEMKEPGAYLAIDSAWGGPVAACRGEDGNVYAFANVCCHRGAKVVQGLKGQGSIVGLVCPYHAWTYDYDGKLKWAPGMDASRNFDEDQVRLAPVRVEIFKGFVFVNVSDDGGGGGGKGAPSLRDCLGDLPEKLPAWFGDGPGQGAADGMVCVARREFDVPCNWKFLMENTCETYHTSIVHKNSLGPMKATPMGPHRGDWDAVLVPSERSIVPLPDDTFAAMLPTFTRETAFVNLFPSLQFNVTWDCMWWMRLVPTGPTSTHILMGFCFPEGSTHQFNFDRVLQQYLKRWEMAVGEDNAISMNQQRGVRSKFRKPGRFSQLEFGTHNMNNWLVSKMLESGGKGAWDPGRRVYVGEGEMFSNDDARMTRAAEEVSRER